MCVMVMFLRIKNFSQTVEKNAMKDPAVSKINLIHAMEWRRDGAMSTNHVSL